MNVCESMCMCCMRMENSKRNTAEFLHSVEDILSVSPQLCTVVFHGGEVGEVCLAMALVVERQRVAQRKVVVHLDVVLHAYNKQKGRETSHERKQTQNRAS